MEKNRVLLIGNDAFLPPSKRIGLSDDVVAKAFVPLSARRVLTTLTVESTTGISDARRRLDPNVLLGRTAS